MSLARLRGCATTPRMQISREKERGCPIEFDLVFEGAVGTLLGRKGATAAWLVARRIIPQAVSRALDDAIVVRRVC